MSGGLFRPAGTSGLHISARRAGVGPAGGVGGPASAPAPRAALLSPVGLAHAGEGGAAALWAAAGWPAGGDGGGWPGVRRQPPREGPSSPRPPLHL